MHCGAKVLYTTGLRGLKLQSSNAANEYKTIFKSWKLWVFLHWSWISIDSLLLIVCFFCPKTPTFRVCVQWVDITWPFKWNSKINAEFVVYFGLNILTSERQWKLRKLVPAMISTHRKLSLRNDIKMFI